MSGPYERRMGLSLFAEGPLAPSVVWRILDNRKLPIKTQITNVFGSAAWIHVPAAPHGGLLDISRRCVTIHPSQNSHVTSSSSLCVPPNCSLAKLKECLYCDEIKHGMRAGTKYTQFNFLHPHSDLANTKLVLTEIRNAALSGNMNKRHRQESRKMSAEGFQDRTFLAVSITDDASLL